MNRQSYRVSETIVTAACGTPIGVLRLYGCTRGLLAIVLPEQDLQTVERKLVRHLARSGVRHVVLREEERALADVRQQLAEYFAGLRRRFTVPVYLCGTPFQQRVWQLVGEIPFGTTWTYRELAERLVHPTAVRAVGAALAANPLPIVIPCHRVVGARGALRGYAGGLALKEFLLTHERAVAQRP